MGVKKRGYDEKARRIRGVTAAVTAAATSSAVSAAAKGWKRDGMEHHRSPLAVAKLHGHSPDMTFFIVASLDCWIPWYVGVVVG